MGTVARIILTLMALVAFAVLARDLAPPASAGHENVGFLFQYEEGVRETVMGLGLVLLGAWLMGKLAQKAKLSKITGYIVFGLVMGPHVLGVIEAKEVEHLQLANDLAIALIALAAGGEIDLGFVKRSARMIAIVVGLQAFCVLSLVGVAMTIVFRMIPSLGVGASDAVAIASMVAVVATSFSPAVVIALIDEVRARGTFTQTVLTIVVCMDLLLIVLFSVGMVVVTSVLGRGSEEGAALSVMGHIAQHLIGSLCFGAVLGLLLALYVHYVGAHLVLVLVGASFGTALLSDWLGLEPLLAALSAGVLMRNLYPAQTKALFAAVHELSVPVYAVFFTVAGCKANPTVVAAVWPAVVALVAVRAGSIVLGTWLGTKAAKVEELTKQWAWTAFISQAGVSLALAYVLSDQLDRWVRPEGVTGPTPLFSVLVSAIAIHELVGPVLFKLGLTRTGDAGRASV